MKWEAAMSGEPERESDQYERHLAAEIAAMLPDTRVDAFRLLRLVLATLEMKLPRTAPEISEPTRAEGP
jgi:hypothetical protein